MRGRRILQITKAKLNKLKHRGGYKFYELTSCVNWLLFRIERGLLMINADSFYHSKS